VIMGFWLCLVGRRRLGEGMVCGGKGVHLVAFVYLDIFRLNAGGAVAYQRHFKVL